MMRCFHSSVFVALIIVFLGIGQAEAQGGWYYGAQLPNDRQNLSDEDQKLIKETTYQSEGKLGPCISALDPNISGSPSVTKADISNLFDLWHQANNWLDNSGFPSPELTTSEVDGKVVIFCSLKQSILPRLVLSEVDPRAITDAEKVDGKSYKPLALQPSFNLTQESAALHMAIASNATHFRLNDHLLKQLEAEKFKVFGVPEAEAARIQNGAEWVYNDGLLPALGYQFSKQSVGEKYGDFSNAVERHVFMPGRYNIPIYQNSHKIDERYTAAAFWSYVSERYVDKNSEFNDLMLEVAKSENTINVVDKFIDDRDGEYRYGLDYALPEFVAIYLSSQAEKFPTKMTEKKWLDEVIGGCELLEIDETRPYSRVDVSIPPFASRCFEYQASSLRRAWDGAVTLRLSGAPDIVDNIQFAYSSAVRDGKKEINCSDIISKKEYAQYHGCIETPESSISDDGLVASRFHFWDSVKAPVGQAGTKNRFIVSYIPSDPSPYQYLSQEGGELALTFTVDLTGVEEGWFGDSSLSSSYARKRGHTPAGAPPSRQVDSPDRSVLKGDAVGIDPGILRQASQWAEYSISIEDEDGNNLTFSPGDRESFKRQIAKRYDSNVAITTADGRLGIADPKKKSFLEIKSADAASMSYDGEAHVCLISSEDMVGAVYQSDEFDICKNGERRTIKIFGAIPFPKIWTEAGALRPFETENSRRLDDLRLARIEAMGGFSGILNSAPASSLPGTGPANRSGNASGETASCSLLTPTQSCDCSCPAKLCLSEKQSTNSLSGPELSCRLTCGKKWKTCAN